MNILNSNRYIPAKKGEIPEKPNDSEEEKKIKNTFGSLQTNSQADAWWVVLILFLKKKHVFVVHPNVRF